MQYDVRVTSVELTLVAGIGLVLLHDLELFNAPNLNAWLLPSSIKSLVKDRGHANGGSVFSSFKAHMYKSRAGASTSVEVPSQHA